MDRPHRPLSLAGLRGFAAAATQLSFTRAAADLHLTQSALSRQIQGLEQELGQPLFVRGTRALALTPAGEALWRALGPALRRLDDCVTQLRAGSARRRIIISTFASAASLWLVPRLKDFGSAHPDVDVHCLASDRMVNLEAEGVDLALRCAPPDGARAGALPLFPEVMTPVCSPALLASADPPLARVADLARHTLLKMDEMLDREFPWLSWPAWFAQRGEAQPPGRNALRFSSHDQVIQAALAGQGVALARTPLIADLLDDGRLAMPFGPGTRAPNSYLLVVSASAAERPEVRDFVAWIQAEAAITRRKLERLGSRRTRAGRAAVRKATP
jgi:LysR family glycine cleavage system transcriptional activator